MLGACHAVLYGNPCDDYRPCHDPVSYTHLVEVFRLLKEAGKEPAEMELSATDFAKLLEMLGAGEINRETARLVLAEMFSNGVQPGAYVDAHGLRIENDAGALLDIVDRVIAGNTKSVEDFLGGKEKAFGFLVGQCMRELKGKADPKAVNAALREKLESMR